MKTQNNNQETGKSQVSKLTLRTAVVLFSAVLVSATVNAQDLLEQLSNTVSYGKMTLTMDEHSNETKNVDAAIVAIQSELDNQLNFSNSTFVAIESEETMEVESWMTEEKFFQYAEQYTANGADLEIAKYAEKIINSIEAEEDLTIESWMIEASFFLNAEQFTAQGTDQEIAKYAEKIISNIDKEESITIENWMLDSENFSNQSHYDHLAVN